MVTLHTPQLFGLQTFAPNATVPSGRTLVSGTGSGSRYAFVVRVPRTGNLRYVTMGFSTITSPQDVRLAVMDVTNNSSAPDNTDDAYVVVPSASLVSNTMLRMGPITHDGTPGGNMKAVVAGEPLAITFRWESASGTVVTFNQEDTSGTPQNNAYMAYTTRWGASNWSGSSLDAPRLTLEYDDGTVESVAAWMNPYANRLANTHGSTSSPDEYALYWVPRFSGKIARLGSWVGNTSGTLEWSVYQDTTLLERYTSSVIENTGVNSCPAWGFFDDLQFSKDVLYRLSVRPTTANSISGRTFDMTPEFRAANPWGPLGCLSTRTDNGAWTENITRMPFYLLALSAIEL